MKANHSLLCLLAVASIISLGAVALAAGEKSQAELQAKAKLTKEQAQKIALDAVPNATVKSAELEEEKGKLIWSFDLATPGAKDTTEVGVDAIDGKVVENKTETAADEAKEKKEDEKKGKKEHEKA